MRTESDIEINETEIHEAEEWLGEEYVDYSQAVGIVDNLLTIIRYMGEDNAELTEKLDGLNKPAGIKK